MTKTEMNETVKTALMEHVEKADKKFVLFTARHSHPAIDGLDPIFGAETDPMDFLGMLTAAERVLWDYAGGLIVVYVTGLTPATVALINECIALDIKLVLMHYDRGTDSYVPQKVGTF